MKNISTQKGRILEYIDYKGISKNKFYKETGISNGVLDKSSGLSMETVEKFYSTYSEINPEWLLTGKGDMIKSDLDKFNNSMTSKESIDSYKKTSLGQTRSEYLLRTDRRKQEQLVPLYSLEASAGLVQLFQDSSSIEPIDMISIPNLPKCDGAVYVAGDSMYPLLKSGDIVMYKQVMDLPNDLFWGEMYLIHIDLDGDTYTTVKYVQRSEHGTEHIKLVSYNQHHAPKDIHLSKIKAAALVKASVRINSMM